LFDAQNYFELDGAIKGLVASGPIAAYAIFVYVGWRIFREIIQQKKLEKNVLNCRSELKKSKIDIEQLKKQNDELSQAIFGLTPSKEIAEQIVGKWEFTSESIHKRVLTGESSIQFRNGVLRLNGNFQENRHPIAEWFSELAQVVDSSALVIVYSMRELKNNEYKQYRAVCTFQLSNPPINEMTGFWIVVGRNEMYGTVEYRKKET